MRFADIEGGCDGSLGREWVDWKRPDEIEAVRWVGARRLHLFRANVESLARGAKN